MTELTIIIKDEINCNLIGISSEHNDILYNQFGLKINNWFFNPKVKLGVWDGKIRLYSSTGKTYVYLLEQIVPRLLKWKYDVRLQDNRKSDMLDMDPISADIFSHVKNEHGDPYILRPYQVEAVNAVLHSNGGIIIAGTGAGKTLIGASIAKSYEEHDLKTITIVPSKTLVFQSAEDYKMWGLDCGQYCGDIKELGHQHMVTTWQSLQNVPTILKDYDVVNVDECHGAKAMVLAKMLEQHGNHMVYRFGMTGTMPDYELDNLQVKLMLGDVKYEIPAHSLIDGGFLSTIKITIKQLVEPFDDQYFPDYTSEKNYLQSAKPRSKWIAEFTDNLSNQKNSNVLMLVTSIAAGKQLTKMIPNAHFVYGADKTTARKNIYNLFKTENNLVVVTTAQVAGTGLSINRIFNLILVDIGKSSIRVIQAIGRGLRKDSKTGKTHCNAYDICSSLKHSRKHLTARTKHYRDHQYPYKIERIEYHESNPIDSDSL